MPPPSRIRNFSIVAHIDHGKSTLADRLLERTGALGRRDLQAQVLDDMELERERGITIKARAVRLDYRAADGSEYVFNLIDTPGHVDFSYEVSRSLAACEGALLVVDAAQGVQAQTLANAYLAVDGGLELLPVINKIDVPAADPERVRAQIEQVVGLDASRAALVSAKAGLGIDELLARIVTDIPPPAGDPEAPLKALLFDSWYDVYRGVVCLVRIVDGTLRRGERIRFVATGGVFTVEEIGAFHPRPRPVGELSVGEVGYLYANVKDLAQARVGDTITHLDRPTATPLPGFQEAKPMVFAGLYPVDADDYEDLRDAVEKLRLNDASFRFEPETSSALGFGFRCGFLGLLHMEIIQERLEREFDLRLITTAPGVRYRVTTTSGETVEIASPAQLPDAGRIAGIEEPYIRATIVTRSDSLGGILALSQERRGVQQRLEFLAADTVLLGYDFPLAEVVHDFYDRLKSVSRGYASFDYELAGYREGEIVRLDILVNGEPVDSLSLMIHREKAYAKGKALVEKMQELIPRQLFEIVLQAAVGSRVIARASVRPLRKDVLAKCYGGDISRKRKLLEKQKEGKRRMKSVGAVEIPQEAFLAVLKVDG
ncbi:MAG: elongation factor 4 [Acidobacteria bacterium]|nr:translation elongation factor 4 [Thermoanaerobaculia bacterium]MDI9630569.1 translation elongation factor 4 [Acidobacteriota bacterium]MBP7814002.1 translation elongation factor 4 [Thermoanaerobaculia bacterium]MBP8846314.1 translation elongation factor 4 [Thermoanaerobaculia bacterium]NLN12160.1 elongation factor 4 [Acidobacteriota bacterium]